MYTVLRKDLDKGAKIKACSGNSSTSSTHTVNESTSELVSIKRYSNLCLLY